MAEQEDKGERWEIIFGLILAIFAAALAVCDLGAGKFGDDEKIAVNEKASQYSYYQSKSIKQSLAEGQATFLESMLTSGTIDKSQQSAVQAQVDEFKKKAARYEKEKAEILDGSAKVGQENWANKDDKGELGHITGAREWETKAKELGDVGDVYDKGTLFLQMCLVLGAIGIIIRNEGMKKAFLVIMVVLGVAGSYYTWVAWQTASKI